MSEPLPAYRRVRDRPVRRTNTCEHSECVAARKTNPRRLCIVPPDPESVQVAQRAYEVLYREVKDILRKRFGEHALTPTVRQHINDAHASAEEGDLPGVQAAGDRAKDALRDEWRLKTSGQPF